MPISVQNLISPTPRSHLCSHSSHILPHYLKSSNLPIKFPRKLSHFEALGNTRSLNHELFITRKWPLRVYESNSTVQREGVDKVNWDVFLPVAELICLVPSAILSIACVVNWSYLNSQKSILFKKLLAWQLGLLVGAVFIGGLIRRRQWGRICGVPLNTGVSKLDLVGRIEKLEEDLRSSTTIIRMLSRQLEKLGIRFRVTRKSLKEPISEAAALALKNSEATQALQMQKDILEKELGEIQKVLLAMQDQQHKQLELILTIVKSGKFKEIKREESTRNSVSINKEERQMDNKTNTTGVLRQKIVNNDTA